MNTTHHAVIYVYITYKRIKTNKEWVTQFIELEIHVFLNYIIKQIVDSKFVIGKIWKQNWKKNPSK